MQRLKSQQPRRPETLRGRARRLLRDLTGFEVSVRRYRAEPIADKHRDVLESMTPDSRERAIQLEFGIFDAATAELHVTHTAGLYSCITVTVWMLADLLAEGHFVKKINFARTLDAYKEKPLQDLYPELYSTDVSDDRWSRLARLPASSWRRFDHHGNYRDLPFEILNLLIEAYFRPSRRQLDRTKAIEDRYLRPGARYLGVCYRGTDKATEVMPIDSAVYLERAERLLDEGHVDRLLIQTDQSQVCTLFQRYFGDRCDAIDRLPRARGTVAVHDEAIEGSRLDFALDMISAVTLLAHMEQVLVYTGNVGAWIVIARGSSRGVWQATPKGIAAQF